jgi:hypothetical protein
MSLEEIRLGTQRAWDRFYIWRHMWARSRIVESMRARRQPSPRVLTSTCELGVQETTRLVGGGSQNLKASIRSG